MWDLLLGKQCAFCGELLRWTDREKLCTDCSEACAQLHYTKCDLLEPDGLPAYALYAYKEPIRQAVLRFKYQGNATLAQYAAPLLAERCRALDITPDLITCIPRASDEKPRPYSQSEVLARATARVLRLPFSNRLLAKNRGVRSQTLCRNAATRERNARRAYRILPSVRLCGETVLLIDDVVTTGATARACALQLRGAGAGQVLVFSFARTVVEHNAAYHRMWHRPVRTPGEKLSRPPLRVFLYQVKQKRRLHAILRQLSLTLPIKQRL